MIVSWRVDFFFLGGDTLSKRNLGGGFCELGLSPILSADSPPTCHLLEYVVSRLFFKLHYDIGGARMGASGVMYFPNKSSA